MGAIMPRFLIIITAADLVRANQDAMRWDPDGGRVTFMVPLNDDGLSSTRPSHYWASGVVSDAEYVMVENLQATSPGSFLTRWDMDADPGLPNRALAQMGLQRTKAAQ